MLLKHRGPAKKCKNATHNFEAIFFKASFCKLIAQTTGKSWSFHQKCHTVHSGTTYTKPKSCFVWASSALLQLQQPGNLQLVTFCYSTLWEKNQ